jgi:hypothetical protein
MGYSDDIDAFIDKIIDIIDSGDFAPTTAMKAIKDECVWTRQMFRKKYDDDGK